MEGWEIYPTQVAGEPTLVAVDLRWSGEAKDAELVSLLWVRVPFTSGAAPMLPADAERERLDEVETWLTEELDRSGGVQVARLSMPGRREFFAYTPNNMAEAVLAGLQARFPQRAFETRGRDDADWLVYKEFLYPTPLQMRRIENQRMVRNLEAHGDILLAPRVVTHRAFFHDDEIRDEFASTLVRDEFEVELVELEDEEATRPFGVVARRLHAVDLATLDTLVLRLFEGVRERGGTYEGWTCDILQMS